MRIGLWRRVGHIDIVVFVIPDWTDRGLLPPGEHVASWQEVRERFGWNSRRESLLLGLHDFLAMLARAGCTQMWLDGSFVTDKDLPGDYDACWRPQGVDPSVLDPIVLDFSSGGRALAKARYQGDLFVAGIETGSGLPFVKFFQQTREGDPKGIVVLNPQEHR